MMSATHHAESDGSEFKVTQIESEDQSAHGMGQLEDQVIYAIIFEDGKYVMKRVDLSEF